VQKRWNKNFKNVKEGKTRKNILKTSVLRLIHACLMPNMPKHTKRVFFVKLKQRWQNLVFKTLKIQKNMTE